MFFDFKTFSHRMQMPFVAANRLHLGHRSASDILCVILSSECFEDFRMIDETWRISQSSELDVSVSSCGWSA